MDGQMGYENGSQRTKMPTSTPRDQKDTSEIFLLGSFQDVWNQSTEKAWTRLGVESELQPWCQPNSQLGWLGNSEGDSLENGGH